MALFLKLKCLFCVLTLSEAFSHELNLLQQASIIKTVVNKQLPLASFFWQYQWLRNMLLFNNQTQISMKANSDNVANSNIESRQCMSIGVPPEIRAEQTQIKIGAQTYLQFSFTLNSYEEALILAMMYKKQFEGINFSVQQWQKNENDNGMELRINFNLISSRVEQISKKFGSRQINIRNISRMESTQPHRYEMADFLCKLMLRSSKYVLLRTHYFGEQLRKQLEESNYLFEDPTLPLQPLSKQIFLVTNTNDRSSDSDGNAKQKQIFPQCLRIQQAKCFFTINNLSTDQIQLFSEFQNSQVASNIEGIKIILEFSNKINYFIEVSFQNEEQLINFLVKHYKKYQKILLFEMNAPTLSNRRYFDSMSQLIQYQRSLFQAIQTRMKNVNDYINILEDVSLERYQQSEPVMVGASVFQHMAHKLQLGGDLLCLEQYWCPQVRDDMQQLYNTWEIEKYQQESIITTLFTLLNDKIHRQFTIKNKEISLYEWIYPGITAINHLFVEKLNIKLSTKAKGRPNHIDEILMAFINQIYSLNRSEGGLIIELSTKERVPLKTVIADCEWFIKNSIKWNDVFNCLTINLRNQKHTQSEISDFINQIENCRYPVLDCLGCSKFFYYNYTNLVSPNKRVPTKIFPLVEKMSDYQTQILQSICVMLNNHGGVILFNCVREYKQILPRGCLLSQKDKEAIENKINYMLGFIYPRPEINKNITISFVPVVYHPLSRQMPHILQSYNGEEKQLKPSQMYLKPTYLEGTYITRIKVCPTDHSRVYLHTNGSEYFLYGINNHQKTSSIKKLRQVIKFKFNNHLKNQKLAYKDKTFDSPLNHICQTPDSGVIIDSKNIVNIESNPNQAQSLEDRFPHASMIICRQKYLKHIKERLQAHRVECQVEVRFSQYKFKSAVNTAVLYHDWRLQDLVRLFRFNNEFCFEDKYVLPIYITKYIKIEQTEHLNLKDVESASMWLQKEYPKQKLKLYEFRMKGKKEYFLQTESKLSTLFIYHIFQSFDIKVSFKNPVHLDRISENELKEIFREIPYIRNHQSQEVLVYNETFSQKIQSARETLFSIVLN